MYIKLGLLILLRLYRDIAINMKYKFIQKIDTGKSSGPRACGSINTLLVCLTDFS